MVLPREREHAGCRKRFAAGPPMQCARSLRWPPAKIDAAPGQVRQSGQTAGRSGGVLHLRQPGAKRGKWLLLGPRSHKRIGRLRPSISAPFAQQPGTPEPPGTPPQAPPDPTAPPPYEEPPPPIPIPRPDEPPVIDDPPPRRNALAFTGSRSVRLPGPPQRE